MTPLICAKVKCWFLTDVVVTNNCCGWETEGDDIRLSSTDSSVFGSDMICALEFLQLAWRESRIQKIQVEKDK